MNQIESKRRIIYALIIDRKFSHKGENNPISFNGFDIRELFLLYDRYFFEGKIMRKIKDRGSIHFVTKGKNKDKCGIHIQNNSKYFIDISPFKVVDVAKIKNFDKIQAMQYLLEHNIVHLLLIINSFAPEQIDPNSGYLYLHGKKFKLLYDSLFSKQTINLPERSLPINVNDSCSVDSLLVLLLLCPISELKKILFKRPRFLENRDDSKVENKRNIVSFLEYTYKSVYSGNKIIQLSAFKNFLRKIFPEIEELKEEKISVSTLYDIFTDIFPELKIPKVPVKVITGTKNKVKNRSYGSFQMWDFIDPNINTDEYRGEIIQWKKINHPYLVFQFGGIPDIDSFGGCFDIQKFSEIIIDCKYELCGVIMNHGPKPTLDTPGGSHYVAYIKDEYTLGWCLFDDIGPVYNQINKLPEIVFKNTNFSRPELYFYKKIKI